MECRFCGEPARFLGRNRGGTLRYQCRTCRRPFTDNPTHVFQTAEYLNDARGLLAVQLLVEGTSIRTAERIAGLHRDALIKLLEIAGRRCEAVRDRLFRNIRLTDIQCDEIWGFVYKKEGHKWPDETENQFTGDAWCWIAFDRPTKLVVAWTLGKRTLEKAFELMLKVRRGTSPGCRFQLTTDGLKSYVPAVDEMLSERCDFAQLIKFTRCR